MGQVIDIVFGREGAYPFKSDTEQKDIWKKSRMEAMRNLDDVDRYNIVTIAESQAFNNKKTGGFKLENFGPEAARETLMNIGILLASLSDAQFEQLLQDRKRRERFDPRTCVQD